MLKALNSSFAALLLALLMAVSGASAQDEDVLHPEEAYRYAGRSQDRNTDAIRSAESAIGDRI